MRVGPALRIAVAGGFLAAFAAAGELAADPAVLDAAWTLAALGQQGEDPGLLAAAAEVVIVVAGADPEGRALARDWLAEARFFARGDRRTRARIDAIEAAPPGTPGAALAVARVAEGAAVEIRPGPGKTGFILRRDGPSPPGNPAWDPPVQGGRALDCAPARTGGLVCEAEAGPVVIRGPGPGAAPLFVFYVPADRGDGPAPRPPEAELRPREAGR